MERIVTVNETLRAELLRLAARDAEARARLAADGSLFDGYHPEMEVVHRENAARLRQMIDAHGWPGQRLVATDGAEAAWRVAQHAIGEPTFQRRCLTLLEAAAGEGDVPGWQAAFLHDRICVFEGRLQRYATQFDIGDDGWPFPHPVEGVDRVDEHRASAGIEPLAAQMAKSQQSTPLAAETRAQRERDYQRWLREVGWRP